MLYQAARHYAAAGWPVFPVAPGGKRPLIERGFYQATTDLRRVDTWWRRWPEANIGIPTGAPGFDVLDIDVKPDGTSGYPGYVAARDAGLLDGWALHVRTPSGGMHVYYAGTGQRNGSIPTARLDFRSHGGYVLVPPSRITVQGDMREYRLLLRGRVPPAAVDFDTVRDLLTPRREVSSLLSLPTKAAPDRVASWLARWVAQQHEHSRNRNNGLFWAACRAAEHGITNVQPLIDAAVRNGLDHREATRTVTSAYRTTARQRAPADPDPSPARPGV